jgi:hypothetical protein
MTISVTFKLFMAITRHCVNFWTEAFDSEEGKGRFHRNVGSVFIPRHDSVLRRQRSEHSSGVNANLL